MTDILDLWVLFDAVHLSLGKSDAARRLLQSVKEQGRLTRDQLYRDVERAVASEGEYGELLCQLVAIGEFEHIGKIVRKSRYFKSQDVLVGGILEGIHDFNIHVHSLMNREDYNFEQFNKAIVDFQKLM